MNKEGLVSIIIPTYNRAHILPRAIESVLNQTYQNTELIIVDDCSSDNTQEVANNYCNKDKRVSYIRNKENLGQSFSRNEGIGYSRGAFLMFLDDDCEYLPEKVEEEITLMSSLSPQPAIIYSNMWSEKIGSQALCPLNKKGKYIFKDDILNCKYYILGPPSWFCKREIIKRINGFDVNFYKYVDLDLLMRVIFTGECLYFHNKPLAIVHFVPGISERTHKNLFYRELLLEKHFSKIKKYKRFLSYLYWRIAKDSFHLGDSKKARDYCWKAFISSPLKVEYLFKTILFSFKKLKRNSLVKNREER
ncbi:MAG: glycosyltransferase family 2 protein [Candidatus Omnitrophica bacterium]|nr:glycosyltransferase family 2 protein [Candidatus Omnitrophota bacterium]